MDDTVQTMCMDLTSQIDLVGPLDHPFEWTIKSRLSLIAIESQNLHSSKWIGSLDQQSHPRWALEQGAC